MRVSESIDLPVSQETAWAFLMEWERQASWMKDASWVRVRGTQREGVGTQIRVKTMLYGIPAFVEPMEVTAWEPPTRLAMRHGSVVKGSGEWRLDAHGAGCRFTWIEDVELRVPLIGGFAAKIYSGFMRNLMRGSLANLRARLTD